MLSATHADPSVNNLQAAGQFLRCSKTFDAMPRVNFCAAGVSLALLCACVSAQDVLLQGRFSGDSSEQSGLGSPPLTFSWPASSVYASFEGSSINATLSALEPEGTVSSQYTRFVFFLDQQQVSLETTTPNNTTINWGAANLSNGTHNLTITKISEASYGQASLDALTVGAGGR